MAELLSSKQSYDALDVRVTGLTEDVHGLRADIGDIRATMPSAAAVRDIAAKLEGLSTRLEERNKTQWPTLISGGGFLLAIMVAIGTLAYRPVEATQARHESLHAKYEERYIADLKERLRAVERRIRRGN